jgi:thiol-disulfide isomerase/thioredoxin
MTNATKAKARRRVAPAARSTSRSNRGLWVALGVIALAAVIIAVVFRDDGVVAVSPAGSVSIDRAPGSPLVVGDTVPGWAAPSLTGDGDVRWSDAVGRPTVLSVWAPWCPHCQAELPRLDAALARSPGVQLVTIATAIGDRPGPTPQEYLDGEGLSFTVGVDDEADTLMTGLGVSSFPMTYYVASDGTVMDVTTGEVDPARLDQILATLAAG